MNYSQFSVEAFVLDDYFQKWAEGSLPPEDEFWESWLRDHPGKEPLVSQAKFVLNALRMKEIPLDDEYIAERIERIIALTDPPAPPAGRVLYRTLWFKVAASVAIVCALGWYALRESTLATKFSAETPAVQMVEKENTTEVPLTIDLLDGSTVVLQPESNLQYPEKFSAEERRVYLHGEALFEVAKDSRRPFLVYADELVTKVLGTRFSVRSYAQDQEASVEVFTGKVSVFSTENNRRAPDPKTRQRKGFILTPNQMAVFSRDSERFEKTLVENPRLLAPIEESTQRENPFNFHSTPVQEVFAVLQDYYGVKILYDAELLEECTVTAPLGDEGLYDKLNLICKVIRAEYEIVDAQIIISSRGCN